MLCNILNDLFCKCKIHICKYNIILLIGKIHKKRKIYCALQQKLFSLLVKINQPVDRKTKLNYNKYENSLRMVCMSKETAHTV